MIRAAACALALLAVPGCSFMREYRSRVAAEEAFARGTKAAQRNDLPAAERRFAQALRAEPNSASLRARIGLAYMQMQPPPTARALPFLSQAIELDPRQPFPVYLEAVLAAVNLGREDQARELLARARKAFHDDARALNDIGYTLVDADKLTPEALPLLKRAVELEPDSGIIIDSLGWAYYRLGELQPAAAALEQAVKLTADNAEIQYHLGAVYADLGKTDDARAQFRRALKINPGFDPARAALRRLERAR